MIEQTIDEMYTLVINMQNSIKEDIEDIKEAHNEKLLERNDTKLEMMNEITQLKEKLNALLVEAIQNGTDVNTFREKVDGLEDELKVLYRLNTKLASIVLPIQKMYKDIVDEITAENGGSLIEIKV